MLENVSWTANLYVTGTEVKHIPTRGFLITTRGKVLIENNQFDKTIMSAILIANDANYWFESGYVRDVNILNNVFDSCGEPVINVHPEVLEFDEKKQVHQNIRISNNSFNLKNNLFLSAQSTKNMAIENNSFYLTHSSGIDELCKFNKCQLVKIENNKILEAGSSAIHITN